jgi:hypothetical protein
MRQRGAKRDYKPWLTNQIKKLSYQRDFLKKQTVKFRSAAYDAAYKRHKPLRKTTLKRSLVMQKTVMTVGRQLTAC